MIKTNIIFAIILENMQYILKTILLLGKIRLFIALLLK